MPDGEYKIGGKTYTVHFNKPPSEADIQDAYDAIEKSLKTSPAAPVKPAQAVKGSAPSPEQYSGHARLGGATSRQPFTLQHPQAPTYPGVGGVPYRPDMSHSQAIARYANPDLYKDIPLSGFPFQRVKTLMDKVKEQSGYAKLPETTKKQIAARIENMARMSYELHDPANKLHNPETLTQGAERWQAQQNKEQFQAQVAENKKRGLKGTFDTGNLIIDRYLGQTGAPFDANIRKRIEEQSPEGIIANAFPEVHKQLQAGHIPGFGWTPLGMTAPYTERAASGVALGAEGLVSAENAEIALGLGPLAPSGKLGQLVKGMAAGYFGAQGAKMTTDALGTYAETHDTQQLGKALFGTIIAAGAASHANTELLKDNYAAMEKTQAQYDAKIKAGDFKAANRIAPRLRSLQAKVQKGVNGLIPQILREATAANRLEPLSKMTDPTLRQMFDPGKPPARTPTRTPATRTDFGRGLVKPAATPPAAPLAKVHAPDSPAAQAARPFAPPKVETPAKAVPAAKTPETPKPAEKPVDAEEDAWAKMSDFKGDKNSPEYKALENAYNQARKARIEAEAKPAAEVATPEKPVAKPQPARPPARPPAPKAPPTAPEAAARPHTDPAKFSEWIKTQPPDRATGGNRLKALYEAYIKQHGATTRAEFGQALQGIAAQQGLHLIAPDGTSKPADIFTFKDSTGAERRVVAVRPKPPAAPAVTPAQEAKPVEAAKIPEPEISPEQRTAQERRTRQAQMGEETKGFQQRMQAATTRAEVDAIQEEARKHFGQDEDSQRALSRVEAFRDSVFNRLPEDKPTAPSEFKRTTPARDTPEREGLHTRNTELTKQFADLNAKYDEVLKARRRAKSRATIDRLDNERTELSRQMRAMEAEHKGVRDKLHQSYKEDQIEAAPDEATRLAARMNAFPDDPQAVAWSEEFNRLVKEEAKKQGLTNPAQIQRLEVEAANHPDRPLAEQTAQHVKRQELAKQFDAILPEPLKKRWIEGAINGDPAATLQGAKEAAAKFQAEAEAAEAKKKAETEEKERKEAAKVKAKEAATVLQAQVKPTLADFDRIMASEKTEKPDKETGLTPSQTAFVSAKLKQIGLQLEGEPVTISIPGDGKFTVSTPEGANTLHLNLTGKPIADLFTNPNYGGNKQKTSLPTAQSQIAGMIRRQNPPDTTPNTTGFVEATIDGKTFTGEEQATAAYEAAKAAKKAGKTTPQPAQEGRTAGKAAEAGQSTPASMAERIARPAKLRLNTLAGRNASLTDADLKHPEKGLTAQVQPDAQAALDYAREQAAREWEDPNLTRNWKKIAAYIEKNWPQSKAEAGQSAPVKAKGGGKNGEPPPDAPIVGGGSTPQGGSGKPGGLKFTFKSPSLSGLGRFWTEVRHAFANTFGRGLSRIETESRKSGDPTILRAARTAAGSEASFRVMANRALVRIHDAFRNKDGKGNPAAVQQFWNYLAESRLRGARQRWTDLRDELVAMPDEPGDRADRAITDPKARSLADPKVFNEYLDYLKKMEGRRRDSLTVDTEATEEGEAEHGIEYTGKEKDPNRFSSRLTDTAKALYSNRDYQGLRLFLATAFDDAASSVGVMHDFASANPAAADFDAYGQKPEVKTALTAYREEIGNPLTQSYRANKGELSDYLGPLDTYYPLVPFREGGSGTPAPAPIADFAKVKNPAANFTTGLSERYDTAQEAFLKSAQRAMVRNNRGALINTLQDAGLAHILPRGTSFKDIPKTLTVNGVEVPAVAEPYQGSFTIVKGGKSYRVQSQHILLPKFMADELRPILNSERANDNQIARAIGSLTQAAIIGPTAAVFHAHNLLGSMVAGTPFVGRGLLTKSGGSAPGLKLFIAIDQATHIDPLAPGRAADIQTLARLGQLHPKTGQAAVSPRIREATGARFGPSAGLYGMGGLDLRTRLALLDIARAMHEGRGTPPTDEELYDFISQAGTYTRGLDSSFERSMKRAGVAPFITAGKTQIGVGLRSLSGTTRLPTKGLPAQTRARLRAQQALSGGIVGYVGLWMATNYLYNGRLPNKQDKFGQIKIKPQDRNSPAGRMIFGAGSDPKSVNVAFFNPTMSRAVKASLLEAYVNGKMQGKSADDIAENMQRDAINSWASPITTSPTVREPFLLATGKEPYITSLSQPKPYRRRGSTERQSEIQFIEQVGEEDTGMHRIAMQMKEAVLKANPIGDMIGQVSGLGHRRPDREKDSAGRIAVETILDLAFPRLEAFTYPPKQHSGKRAFAIPRPDAD